uniref:DUF1754-domain-containing protein n=1 Tax=Chlamydomonas leiostraca TaxID=1034604 RepID=A0A7S0S7U0_9CHLO|mmetsp:Transcript_9793/g.24414  ORF Transcript_9793/g.24414 Transcript_9793/m.24414 type:complete len:128 (+) Transcript_9793:152-535(+)
MSFVGGKLKLKGGETLKPAGGVAKKKKKSKDSGAIVERSPDAEGKDAHAKEEKEDLKKILHGYELKQEEGEDRRTEAEKRFQERQIKLEEERLRKFAAKSHRDRVRDFNDHLSKLSEHHDIPRVGPG